MKAKILRRILVGGMLTCALPRDVAFGQTPAQPSSQTVLVTPLLHGGALSDSLARLLRQDLAERFHVALVPGGDVTASLQRTDSVGKAWTFESVRDLAYAFRADALVDVTAVRGASGVKVTVAWGSAPFTIIDNSSMLTQASLDVVARTLAEQITRGGWPASVH